MLRKKLGGVGWGEQNADCLKQTHGLERCQWKLSHNPLVESQCWDCFCCFKGALRLKTFHVYQDNSWAPILFFRVHRCLRAKGLIFFSCVKFAIFLKARNYRCWCEERWSMSCPTMGPGRLQNLEVSSKRMSERIDNLARRERDRATWRFFCFWVFRPCSISSDSTVCSWW